MKHRKKVCTHCGRKLWLREFYVSKRGWTASWCKDCTKANKRDWYARTRKVPDGLRHDSVTGRITEHKGLSTRIYWSRRMLDDLKRLFPTTKNEELAGVLGVSVRTLIRKARELGIWKSKEWQHAITMEHQKMAEFEHRRLGHPSSFKKGEHYNPEGEFKKGHQLTTEEKAKQKEALRRYNLRHPYAAKHRCRKLMKPVLCEDTGETFPSISDAAASIGVRPSYLSDRTRKGKTAKGKTFRFINNQQKSEAKRKSNFKKSRASLLPHMCRTSITRTTSRVALPRPAARQTSPRSSSQARTYGRRSICRFVR